jgi:hypothetical protein
MGWGIAAAAAVSAYGAIKGSGGADDMAEEAKKRGREQKIFNYATAKHVVGSGQAAMFESQREAELMASRAIAVSAAGGYVADVDHLVADIYGEGAYRASIAMREAEMEAESLRFAGDQAAKYGTAQSDLYKGQADATRINAVSGLLTAASYADFGSFGGTPKPGYGIGNWASP